MKGRGREREVECFGVKVWSYLGAVVVWLERRAKV